MRVFIVLWLLASFYPSASYGQNKQNAGPSADVFLSVGGEVARPLKLSAADFAKLPRHKVRAKGHNRKEAEYEGTPLIEVLQLAGVALGESLRGKSMALYLVVEATDGYRVVFALPELDPAFTDRVVLLADRKDGEPLDASDGPLCIIVPDEKRPTRWVRQVTSLIVRRA
jgi:DMSO/TMAO reductase YedYZ molybdopterin-dependent catalytic subunit